MIGKIILSAALLVQAFAFADVCSSECNGDSVALGSGKKWYCIAKDACGQTFIPECGNTCFSHAVDDAVALCAESSKDSDTCEVIDKNGGSCSTDREQLVRLSKK